MGLCLIRKRYYFYYRTLTKKYRNSQHSFRFVFKERTLRRSRERFLRSISNKSLSGSAEAGGSYGDPICGSPSRCQEMQSPSSRPESPSQRQEPQAPRWDYLCSLQLRSCLHALYAARFWCGLSCFSFPPPIEWN